MDLRLGRRHILEVMAGKKGPSVEDMDEEYGDASAFQGEDSVDNSLSRVDKSRIRKELLSEDEDNDILPSEDVDKEEKHNEESQGRIVELREGEPRIEESEKPSNLGDYSLEELKGHIIDIVYSALRNQNLTDKSAKRIQEYVNSAKSEKLLMEITDLIEEINLGSKLDRGLISDSEVNDYLKMVQPEKPSVYKEQGQARVAPKPESKPEASSWRSRMLDILKKSE